MAVEVHGHLDGAVTHLILDVYRTFTVLQQERCKGAHESDYPVCAQIHRQACCVTGSTRSKGRARIYLIRYMCGVPIWSLHTTMAMKEWEAVIDSWPLRERFALAPRLVRVG